MSHSATLVTVTLASTESSASLSLLESLPESAVVANPCKEVEVVGGIFGTTGEGVFLQTLQRQVVLALLGILFKPTELRWKHFAICAITVMTL